MRRRSASTLVVGGALLGLLALGGTAVAAWLSTGAGIASATAADMPVGATPTAAANGTGVNIAWAGSTLSGHGLLTSYEVKQYNDAANPTTVCVSAIQQSGTNFSCAIASVGEGNWSYSVTPLLNQWRGGESSRSNAVQQLSAPTDLQVTGISKTSVTLSWHDTSSSESGFDIERVGPGSTTVVLTTGASSTNPVTYIDNSVACGNSYSYRVRAAATGSTSGYSTAVGATTTVCAPAGTFTLTATGNATDVSLSWTAVDGATSYRVEYHDGTAWATLAADLTGTTHTDPIGCGLTRNYRVIPVNAGGDGSASNEASATTGSCTPTGSPTLTATGGATSITLSWTTVSGATNYRPEWLNGSTWTSLGLQTTTTHIDNVGCGVTRTYRVVPIFTSTDGTPSAQQTASTNACTQPPASAPTLSTPTVSGANINLSWTSVSGATSYRVERFVSPNWTTVTTTANTTYSDPVGCGQSRTYRVIAVNAGGDGPVSNSQSASTIACPAAPTNLATGTPGTTATGFTIPLTWTDNATNESGFTITRTLVGVGTTATFSPAANAISFTDSTVECGKTYSYAIRADNAAGSSASVTAPNVTAAACSTAMRVTGMSPSSSTSGQSNWRATATITVTDASGAVINNAEVTVSFTAANGTSLGNPVTCKTGQGGQASGVCAATSGNLALATHSSVTATVTDVVLTGRTYQPTFNTPNPTTIIINKP